MEERIIVIGAGGIGCQAADAFVRMNDGKKCVFPLLFDTDLDALQDLPANGTFDLTSPYSFGETVADLGDSIRGWFPVSEENTDYPLDIGENLDMCHGANLFRMKALVAFARFLREDGRELLDREISRIAETEGEYTVYTVASLVGGTGSGLFLPLSLYVARALALKGIHARFYALLSPPDAIQTTGSATQKTKMYGNAYAALRELNAVISKCNENNGFAIGTPDDPFFGQLYPMPETWSADDRFFSRVYLAGKTSGVISTGDYVSLLADELNAISDGVFEKEFHAPSDDICAYLSAAALVYPSDSVKKYVAARTVREIADVRLRDCERVVADAELSAEEAKRKKDKNEKSSDISQADETTDKSESDNSETDSGVTKYFDEYNLSKPDLLSGKMREYTDSVIRSVRGHEEDVVTGAFSDQIAAIGRGDYAFRLFDRKKTADKKFNEFRALIAQCQSELAAYSAGIMDTFAADVTATMDEWCGDGELSLPVLLQIGKEDPAQSLESILALQRELKERSEKFPDLRFLRRPEEDATDYLDRIAHIPSPVDLNEITANFRDAKDITRKNTEPLTEQLKTGHQQIRKTWEIRRECAAITLLDFCVDRLAEMYQRLIQACRNSRETLIDDEQLYYRESPKSSGHITYVSCTPEDKESIYKKYHTELSERIRTARILTKLKETIRDAIRPGRPLPSIGELTVLTDEWMAAEVVQAESDWSGSETFRALCERSVIGIRDSDDGRTVARQLAGLSCRSTPVFQYRRTEDPKLQPRRSSMLLLPEAAAAYLMRAKDGSASPSEAVGETCGPAQESVIRSFLLSGMCTDAEFQVRGDVSPLRVLCLSCTENLTLSGFPFLSEAEDGADWYREYCKCRYYEKKFQTLVWYPYMTFGTHSIPPYVDDRMDDKYCCALSKAFIYLLATGKLFTEHASDGKDVVCFSEDDSVRILTADNRRIESGDYRGIFAFLTENELLTQRFADSFDTWIKRICDSLPISGIFPISWEQLERAVTDCELVRMLCARTNQGQNTLSLIPMLNDWAAPLLPEDETARAILHVLHETLYGVCAYRTSPETADRANELYMKVIDRLQSDLSASLVQTLAAWIPSPEPERD